MSPLTKVFAYRATNSSMAMASLIAVMAVFGSDASYSRELTGGVFLCTLSSAAQTILQNNACDHGDLSQRSAILAETPRITFSRAADLIGRPVRYRQPIRMTQGQSQSAAGLRLSGMMPSSMPVTAYGLTSSFGLRQHPLLGGLRSHAGIDLAAPIGSPIFATSDGTVSMADWRGGYGLFVSLDHGSGIQTRYGHMSRLNVASGQQVRKGDVIGFVGSTGRSTGPHLHYEVRLNGQPINPVPLLKSR